jgi:katanin p60 ATPase-containing subunit A1
MKTEMFIQMDGVQSSASTNCVNDDANELGKNVMVLAATNRPWDLDEAMIRRLEKRIYIPLPKEEGRQKMFEINMRELTLGKDVDFKKLIELTERYSGADISNVC